MKHKIKRGIFYLILGFVVLFGLRLMYGYIYVEPVGNQDVSSSNQGFEFSSKNYASEKKVASVEGQAPSVDQKYEKVASVASQSQSFDEDEKRLREMAVNYNALIQYEQNFGLAGRRRLNLAIGVPPSHFDAMVAKVKEIGKTVSFRVDKTDKTNEYKDLNAKKVSLEKTRDALIALKSKGGRIDESINLENRILEIESELQALGVSLGEFDKENEFCTVKVTLEEGAAAIKTSIPFIHRVKVALEWTVRIYLRIVAMLFVIVFIALGVTMLLEKLKWLPAVTKDYVKSNESIKE